MKSFLIVEDDDGVRDMYEVLIRKRYENIHIDQVGNGQEALKKIEALDYTVILVDLEMPVMNGRELYRKVKGEFPHLAERMAFLSGKLHEPKASFPFNAGCRYLAKPFNRADFYRFIDSFLESAEKKFVAKYGKKCTRRNVRFRTEKKCILKQANSDSSFIKYTPAETVNYSLDGLTVRYEGEELPAGDSLYVSVDSFDISRKKARVVWSKCVSGTYKSGLEWISD